MDASQYKDYVLVLLFVKYVSDKYAGQKGALLDVPKGGRFADMVALKGDKEIGDKMNKIISKLAEANDLKGVIDVADFNGADKLGKGKEMVDRLWSSTSSFHLVERRHNDVFTEMMDQHLPLWRQHRNELNVAPLAHADWSY